MKAVVPAAGEGTRLRPLTADRPKGLVEVADRPILAHCFETLRAISPEKIIVVVGYRGDQIRARFGDEYQGLPLRYVEQPEPNGLGDAVLRAEPYVEDTFVVLNGDNIFTTPPAGLLDVDDVADGAMLVERVDRETARMSGVVISTDDTVQRVVENRTIPRRDSSMQAVSCCRQQSLMPVERSRHRAMVKSNWVLLLIGSSTNRSISERSTTMANEST